MTASAPTTHLAAEIATQPANWMAARSTAERHAQALPQPGEKVAVIGCGTSLYMAQAYAALREGQGDGITDAWTPTEARLDRGYDRLLAITRSGTTTEVVDLLAGVRGRIPATVISSSPGTPALELAEPILTPEVDERSVVQTRFATTTLAMLRWHLGQDLSQAAEQAQQLVEADESAFGPALTAEQITFVGRGWTNGVAQEAALKLRESAQLWTESYPMMEYRHGPLSISAPGRVVWAFGDLVPGFAEDVEVTGADLVHHEIDPLAELVRVHLLCVARAGRAGLDPDAPRNLTRSIILNPPAARPA
ncbi:SIS domain-containing protein [Nocardioides panzhihuensis]|uniref:Fructoselysine-6-P-deglycase FrlB-like protein n=1 Tax=Nocardioides panzhihuensis TaxID=860243 RepID=A0A7Z0DJN3_9ACTN|nr:sugar isomerase [Nocardioides panzhihuensis]NYI76840.1 fructoselysine-6-P-deglycase FrlB-like protein [Nocardioides panzhihuensis]